MAGDPMMYIKVAANIAELKTAMAEARLSVEQAGEAVRQSGASWTDWLEKGKSALSLLGISVTAAAFIQLTREIMADADALVKLHDKTDISIEDLQRLRAIGDDAGVSIESIAAAANKLQMKLGTGDAGANAALAELHLNVKEFLTLDAAQQFFAIAEAVGKIDDPLTRARVLSELYGKTWAEMVPALKEALVHHEGDVRVMSAATTKIWDALGDRITQFGRTVKVTMAEVIVASLAPGTALARDVAEQFLQMIAKIKSAWPVIAPPGLPADLEAINKKFANQAEVLAKIAKTAKEAAEFQLETRKLQAAALEAGMSREIAALRELYTLERENAEARMKLTMTESEFQLFKIQEEAQARKNSWSGPQELAAQYFAQVDLWAKRQVEQVLAGTKQIEQEWVTLIGAVTAANQAMAGGYVLTTNLRPSSNLREQTNLRAMQAGGPVTAQTPYLVGERGPEVFVPQQSGRIVPNGGASITVPITINGSVLSDETKIARAVGDALVGRLRAMGVRLPLA